VRYKLCIVIMIIIVVARLLLILHGANKWIRFHEKIVEISRENKHQLHLQQVIVTTVSVPNACSIGKKDILCRSGYSQDLTLH
jgi:Flp pilus assembly protein CpaB